MFPLLVVRKIMVYEWLLLEMLASMLLQLPMVFKYCSMPCNTWNASVWVTMHYG